MILCNFQRRLSPHCIQEFEFLRLCLGIYRDNFDSINRSLWINLNLLFYKRDSMIMIGLYL